MVEVDAFAADGVPRSACRSGRCPFQALNEELRSAGAWVFSGRLHQPDTATVVRMSDGQVVTTDGPFVEAREHLGGFYIIPAQDLGAALVWAAKATAAVGKPIEVWPFAATEA